MAGKRKTSGAASSSRKKAKPDDANAEKTRWPESLWCEKCLKHTIIAPGHECITRPGSRVCNTCQKGSDTCEKLPMSLHELCRWIENAAFNMEAWLVENRKQAIKAADREKDPGPERKFGWDFAAWKTREGLTHCGKRVKVKDTERVKIVRDGGPADPWAEVPQEYIDLYDLVIEFCTELAKINALKRKNATGASEADKTLLGLLAEAISEIRMFRQAYVDINAPEVMAEGDEVPPTVLACFYQDKGPVAP